MKNIFKRKERFNFECKEQKIIQSVEDKNTQYWEFPDGLRLIFRGGKYVGWYLPEVSDG